MLLSRVTPVAAVLGHPHGLLEAPRFAVGGDLVYSDVIAGGVWACAPEGVVRELLPKRRGIGGIVAHTDGGWVLSGRDLVHLSPDGSQRIVLAADDACGFNDLGTTLAGELLAGELRYRPLAGEAPRNGRLLQIGTDGAVQVLTEEIIWPNGIGAAPDGRTVYVSDYAQKAVLAVSLDGNEVQEFCRSPKGSVDGLALDCEGGVWIALGEGGGVARFYADGQLDEVVPLPASFVSSLCFGGADMCDVLISTADNRIKPELGGTLLRARSDVAGLSMQPTSA